MGITKLQHSCPNLSIAHIQLRKAADAAGVDSESLRNILWLVNAHDQLVAFPHFCTNLLEVLSCSMKIWQVPITAFSFDENSIRCLEWAVTEGPRLATDIGGAQFGREPRNEFDNPVLGRGATRHPLYAALCNGPSTPHLREKFRLLQAHLLYSHAHELNLRTTRDEYENYGEQSPWKGLPNSPSIASLLVRELSELRYENILQSLLVEHPPQRFADSLGSLPKVGSADLLAHLEGFRSFIQKAAGIRDWVSRKSSGGASGGGGVRIHGHVEITSQITQSSLSVSDPDDMESNWGDLASVTSISPTPAEQRELLAQDLFPDEFGTDELLLIGDDDQTRSLGGIAANSGAQLRHVHMANQLLPWNYQNLTISEVSAALNSCSNWVNEHFFSQPDHKHSKEELQRLETICLFRTMLFTCSTLARSRELQILPQGKEGNGGRFALITNNQGAHEWRIQSLQPNYRTNQSATDGSDRPKTDFITLPDAGITARYLKIYIAHLDPATATSGDNYRIFRSRESTLRTNLKSLLDELDPSGRLTESKLSKFLFFRVLDACGGDICAASMIAGEEHRLAHVRLFYSMLPADYLQKVYLNVTEDIVSKILAASGKSNPSAPSIPTYIPGKFVGSRLCPTVAGVQRAIRNIKLVGQPRSNSNDLVSTHNFTSQITLWHFSFATACRAIETPYLPLSDIDQPSGLALLADKDDGTKYKARLAWVPPHVLACMESYEEYRSGLLVKYPYLTAESLPSIFFLQRKRNGSLKALPIRPKMIEALTQPFLPYPANFHRRFMRSELVSRGCPVEVIDAYMGHWSFGEEPWSIFSSFSFQQYRTEMERYLVPLMFELGLDGNPNELE